MFLQVLKSPEVIKQQSMFTGIVECFGKVVEIKNDNGNKNIHDELCLFVYFHCRFGTQLDKVSSLSRDDDDS